MKKHKGMAAIGSLLIGLLAPGAPALAEEQGWARPPDAWSTQLGAAMKGTRAYLVGASWNWNWARNILWGHMSGYSELTFAHWRVDPGGGNRSHHQIGLNPTFRWYRQRDSRWFVDLGAGFNVITPLYRTRDKRFSTEFNFGDHFGLGLELGRARSHELSVRIEHYSNGGIDSPNPGEEFLQFRYRVHIG